MKILNKVIMTLLNKSLPKKYKWQVTDHIMKIEDSMIVGHIPIDIDGSNNEYVCIRNFADTSIYIVQDDYDKFKQNSAIYNDDLQLVNISNIMKYKVYVNASSFVANKVTPAYVKIKSVVLCKIDDVEIYIIRLTELTQTEELYQDLLNYQIIKDKYKLN